MFGRIGDLVGRKYTFLVTIVIMGLSTFIVGLLPGYEAWGVISPVILILLRMLQGLALGGEYGGAATYVAEHAPRNRRGYYTSWIQTTATMGLLLSLIVILIVQSYVNANYAPVPQFSGGEPLQRGDLETLVSRLVEAGFEASIVDEAYNRTLRVVTPDGDELWVAGPYDDLYGYRRLDS